MFSSTIYKDISYKSVQNKNPTPLAYDEEKLKSLVKRYDTDGDGLLSRKELKKAFKNLGATAPGLQAIEALCGAEKNRQGFVGEKEFANLVQYAEKRDFVPTQEKLKSVLRRYDTDGDGRLSKEELKNAFKSLGSATPGWRAMRALHRADNNGDGLINESELVSLVQYAAKRGYVL